MRTLFETLNPETPVRILDIGANPLIEGEASYQSLLNHGFAEVVGFEPQQDALDALNSRKSDSETYLPYALGDGSVQNLNLYKSLGFTSVFAADPKSAEYLGFTSDMALIKSEPVQTRKLDQVAEVQIVDFLKIDVQGSEAAIIRYGRQKLAEACVVQTEIRMFPLYKAEPRLGELESELSNQDFQFLQFATLKHVCLAQRFKKRLKRSEFAQAVDGDAFFVRDLRMVQNYSVEQVKKLAIIADAIIGSHDLTLHALEILLERGKIEAVLIDDYFSLIPEAKLRN
nr:FkbM family methyltransferase [Pontibaca salina]